MRVRQPDYENLFGNLSPKDEETTILQSCWIFLSFLTVRHAKPRTKEIMYKHDLPTTFEIQLKDACVNSGFLIRRAQNLPEVTLFGHKGIYKNIHLLIKVLVVSMVSE